MKILKSLMMIGMISVVFSFIAHVKIPMGLDKRYVVESVTICEGGQAYRLVLKDGSTVYTPVLFTVLEERR